MNWFEFFIALIKILIWPAVVVLCVFILREPLSRLLGLMRRLRYKDLDVEFAQEVRELREIANRSPSVSSEPEEPDPELHARIVQLARISPKAAVLEAWREVEGASRDVVQRRANAIPRSYSQLFAHLKRGIIPEEQWVILSRLYHVRNSAVHAPDYAISENDAADYGELAARLVDLLRQTNGGG